MLTPATKRLMRDFKSLHHDPPAGISGAPYDNNIMLWHGVIFGPDDTPWDGAICLDILQNQWSPIYDIAAILTSIQSLLCDPNPNPSPNAGFPFFSFQSMLCDPNAKSPANSEAALLFSENKREYNRRVREIVEQSWTED